MSAAGARGRAAVRDLLVLALTCAGAFAVVYLVAVRTAWGQERDNALIGGIEPGDGRVGRATEELLSTISVSSLALMGLAIMAIALLRGAPRRALAAGALILGANVATQLLKHGLARPRLDPQPGFWWDDPNSLPSGHTTVAMSLAMALVLVVPASLRVPAAIAGGAYALGVGVAVVALNWHRPSDVVCAYLVTAAWACLVAAALALWPDRADAGRRARGGRWPGLVLAGCVLAVAAVVAVRSLDDLDMLEFAVRRTGFVVATLLCCAVGAALLAAVSVLTDRALSSQGARGPG